MIPSQVHKWFLPVAVTILLVLTTLTYLDQRNVNSFKQQLLTAISTLASSSSSSSSTNSTLVSSSSSSSTPVPENSGLASFEQAKRDSGGFFDDIPDSSWALVKERVRSRINYYKGPLENIGHPPAWYQQNFEPDFTCPHERRIGEPPVGDGPKWVCDPHRLKTKPDCLVYSVGSAGNFMFEEAIHKKIGRHCEIHTFDPEVTGQNFAALAPEYIKYHAWGFTGKQQPGLAAGATTQPKGVFKTMKDTVRELGHQGRVIDIFKIDCEGCEWTTFHEWFDAGASLRQILVEVHATPRDHVNEFFLSMQKAGYVTFHKEPNIQYAGGRCIEYAFLKLEKSFYDWPETTAYK